jgi:hypothetical protein
MGTVRKTSAAIALCALVAFLLTLGASRAAADSITDASGDVYTLTSSFVPESGNTYGVTFTVDTTGYTGAAGFLDGWSLQFTGATSVTIVSASNGSWSNPVTGPVSANGCQNNPGNLWCSEAVSGLPLPGGVYTWLLDVTMPDGTSLGPDSHVQALYGSCADISDGCSNSHNLISADITVPEPGSLMLLGTGLLTMVGLLRRKLFA